MKYTLIALAALLLPVWATAQHEHHMHHDTEPPKKANKKERHDHMHMTDSTMRPMHDTMQHGKGHMNMSHAFSLNLPMNRNGSGTGWLPDEAPMYGKMLHSRKWMYMLHGNVFVRYNSQDMTGKGSRGGSKVDAPNWVMAMGQRRVGPHGLFHFSAMFSLDNAIAGGSGYPLLFQSGETWQGRPLVDRQHPHDLFTELSVSYAHAFSKDADAYVYLGYPGEPALGSVTFMHRPSALANPDAPISHHWNDGTHITFGVATLGFRYGRAKVEASSFTGREPDEDRWGFDRPRFDSWSGRFSLSAGRSWVFQVSQAFVTSPEVTHPGEDVARTTASAIYSHRLGRGQLLNATALWGRNTPTGHDGENAFLLEGSYAPDHWNIYGRYERVQKSVEELNLDKALFGIHTLFPVNAVTLGAQYDVARIGVLRIASGAQGTLYAADRRLDALYGKNPLAGEVYVRLYPTLMRM